MFDECFEVFLADTLEAKQLHYMIRYQVYCEEMVFLPNKGYFLKNEERDQWDKHSVHFLVRHKYTRQWVGAMRLVPPENNILPLFEHAQLLDKDNNAVQITTQSIELSRLCLVKEIRRSYAETDPFYKTSAIQSEAFYSEKKVNLSIIWGLFRAAADYCIKNDIQDWYFLTNKALARLIRREGFLLHQVGDVCERGGRRYPFKMDMDEIFDRKSSSRMVLNDLTESYHIFSQYQEHHELDTSCLSA